MIRRFCVGVFIKNAAGELLLCKMPSDRGVFPGQWATVGGGLEEGETLEQTVHREVLEEVGVEIENLIPVYFREDFVTKIKPGQEPVAMYMINFVFLTDIASGEVVTNEEFEEFIWISPRKALELDLNTPSRESIERMISSGLLFAK